MKIYLAGKISKHDWRNGIVTGGVIIDDAEEYRQKAWPIQPQSIFGQHDYTGPYFLDDRSGHSFEENQHYGDFSSETPETPPLERSFLVQHCFDAIKRSDLVYVWLNDFDAFGTLVEIGYARAMKVHVAIASPEYLPDLWFAYIAADSFFKSVDAKVGLEWFLEGQYRNHMPYKDYLKTDWWKEVREAALERANHRCQVCNGTRGGLNVHHRTYERRGFENPEDVIVLCRDCHALFHKEGKLVYEKAAWRNYSIDTSENQPSHVLPAQVGQIVSHSKFGVGIVRTVEKFGDDQEVMVDFETIGNKRLAWKFAHMEIVRQP